MISATMLAHSVTSSGNAEVATLVLEYPRYIHSELMTHRVFSRNASSSRAIPIEAMIEQVVGNTTMPMWTRKQKGMQGKLVTDIRTINDANALWESAARAAISHAQGLEKLGIHKQNANRLLEPFQHIRVIVTATEWENFLNLRNHEDAQPEIRALAREILCELSNSVPMELGREDWHLPFVITKRTAEGTQYLSQEGDVLTLEQAKMISASCCAQVSYRKEDASLEKAQDIYARLVGSVPRHYSPFEHQCRPISYTDKAKGNLIGFHQLRTDIESASTQEQA